MDAPTPGLSIGIRVSEQSVKEAEGQLQRESRKASDLSAPYRQFETHLHRVTVQAFDRGGRQGEWPQLSDMTLVLRKARGKRANPRRMLQDRGTLKGSFAADISRSEMRYGTSVPYARLHQFGGRAVMKLGAAVIRPKRAKALRFISRSGEVVFATEVHLPPREIAVDIPARPFLVYKPEDETVLLRYINSYLERN